jgi:rubrerythrin
MKISRQTFGRIAESAHRKVAEALVKGKALKIEGGEISMASDTAVRKFTCYDCQHSWELPYGTGRPDTCPSCKGENIHRAEGFGRGPGKGRGICNRKMQGEANLKEKK